MIIDTTNWHWQQWFFIFGWFLACAIAPVMHGRDKGKYNAFSIVLNVALIAFILISGGFFK
jgi:hypothetical protein